MLPAGLGVTCVSQKALAASKTAKGRRCYFDYADMITANANGYFPTRHRCRCSMACANRCACLPRKASRTCLRVTPIWPKAYAPPCRTAGSSSCARPLRSGTRTRSRPSWCPPASTARMSSTRAFRRYNLALGAGLARVAGKLFRIGHLGDCNELMLAGSTGRR